MPYCRMRLIFQCLTLVVAVTGDPPLGDGVGFGRTNLSLPLQLGPEVASAYESALKELNSFWQYNESAYHLSKYEEFDHSHFDDSFEHSGGVESAESGIKDTPSGVSSGVAAPPTGPRAPTHSDPVFDNNLVTNVTAQLGGNAFLHCRVKNLGERPVSWVRRRDWHILTSNMFTYTNDERFQVVHSEGSDDWDLQIKYVQKRDNGTYECQVATGHGTISHYFNLHVVVPSAFILGSGEYHIGEGSTISLVCIIENSPSPPQYVFWYHNERMINYDTSRGGVTVSTEPGPKTHSRLIINSATHADSGNYTCRASNTEADTIHVFVSKDDNTAAIQRQESSAAVAASFAPLSHSPTIILIAGCFGFKILLHSHRIMDHLLFR